MHGWETRMLLKHCLERGVSKVVLSRRFGVSRRTIHAWIEAGELDRDLAAGEAQYSPRPRRQHKLDPYKGIIDARLAEFPRLTARRLFDEVRAAGYEGGYSRVRDYVHKVRPREPAEPAVRFETPPGRQGQVDFGTFALPWGRCHALLVVLGHSRLLRVNSLSSNSVKAAQRWSLGSWGPWFALECHLARADDVYRITRVLSGPLPPASGVPSGLRGDKLFVRVCQAGTRALAW